MNFNNGSLIVGGTPERGITRVYDNNAYAAGDSVSTYSYYFSRDFQMLSVTLFDLSGTVLHGSQLPGAETTKFADGNFTYEYKQNALPENGKVHTDNWTVEGDITGVTQISAVPEPGTYAMLLAGPGIVGWRRRAAGLK